MKLFILCIFLICFLVVVTEGKQTKDVKEAEVEGEEVDEAAKKDKSTNKEKGKNKGKKGDKNKDEKDKKCKGKKKKCDEGEAKVQDQEGKSSLSKKQQKVCEKLEKTLLSCIQEKIYILDFDAYKFKEQIIEEYVLSDDYAGMIEEEVIDIKDEMIEEYINSDAFTEHILEVVEEYNKTDEAQALINKTIGDALEQDRDIMESEHNATVAVLDQLMDETFHVLEHFILLLLNRSLENKGERSYLDKFDFLTSSKYQEDSQDPYRDAPDVPTTTDEYELYRDNRWITFQQDSSSTTAPWAWYVEEEVIGLSFYKEARFRTTVPYHEAMFGRARAGGMGNQIKTTNQVQYGGRARPWWDMVSSPQYERMPWDISTTNIVYHFAHFDWPKWTASPPLWKEGFGDNEVTDLWAWTKQTGDDSNGVLAGPGPDSGVEEEDDPLIAPKILSNVYNRLPGTLSNKEEDHDAGLSIAGEG